MFKLTKTQICLGTQTRTCVWDKKAHGAGDDWCMKSSKNGQCPNGCYWKYNAITSKIGTAFAY